jgi:hypothetical protein
MKRIVAILALFSLVACAGAPNTSPSVTPIVIGEQRVVKSAALGDERQVNISLPADYAQSGARYPVLYLIDGALDQDFHHIAGLAQYGALSGSFDDLIVIGVQTKDRRAELTSPSTDPAENRDFPTNGDAAAFRRFLTEEVRPLIEANYRTNGVDALMGESLAGLFVAETFLIRPETADGYIAISPSLWWDFGSLGKRARKLLDDHPKGERRFYLAIADEKGAMREGVSAIVGALKKEKPKGVDWMFSDRPDLQHSTIYHREALEALSWMFTRPKAE